MRAILNAIMALVIMNVAILLYVYGTGTIIDGQQTTQSLSKLISGYAEPSSNPQFLVRDENQCRFWTSTPPSGYCARAIAKRKSVVAAYAFNPALPENLKATPYYAAYVETRKALNIETTEYVTFLSTNPKTPDYVEKSKQFEEQTSVLVGHLVSYLYDMQALVISRQSSLAQQVIMMQYFGLGLIMLLVCILRFRRGGGL